MQRLFPSRPRRESAGGGVRLGDGSFAPTAATLKAETARMGQKNRPLFHGDAERWNEFVRRATRQNPQAVEVLQGRALPDTDAASEGYRSTEAEEDADNGKSLTNEQTNGRVGEDGETVSWRQSVQLTEPSLPERGKPLGEY